MEFTPEMLWSMREEVLKYYNIATKEHQRLIDNYSPQIIILQDEGKVTFWSDIIDLIDMVGEDLASHQANEPKMCEDVSMPDPSYLAPDMVNQPYHYTAGQYEVVDVIKDWLTEEEFRGYIKGNLIKYISRERYKNGDEDMKKAEFYLHYLNSNGEKGVK